MCVYEVQCALLARPKCPPQSDVVGLIELDESELGTTEGIKLKKDRALVEHLESFHFLVPTLAVLASSDRVEHVRGDGHLIGDHT
jgi:hypothetical protein